MARLRLSEAADADLDAIYVQGIELFGRRQADRYIEGLLETLALIADFPRMARQRPFISGPVRAHTHQAHVLLYDVDDAGNVLVVRIRHAHEDWQSIAQGPDEP